MGRELERAPPHGEPGELTRLETEAGMAIGPHHQRGRIAVLAAHLLHAIGATQHEQRFHNPYVKQQRDPEDRQGDPQRPLPGVHQIEAPPHHMEKPAGDGDDRQRDMRDVPQLIRNFQSGAPQCCHHQCEQ
jgi:hypothetical protein